MRPLPAIVALMLAVASVCVPAQEGARLPDIGSSAGTVLSPADQRAYGEMMLSQLRNYDYILEDPLVDSWLRGVGNRLTAASDDQKQAFTFLMREDRQVNASATVGGSHGVKRVLVLVAATGHKAARVQGHAHAHGTQPHAQSSVDSALRGAGNRLAAASDSPKHDFTFFIMDARQVNAFATGGGYIGVNAGLVLVADTEDDVAGVLGHEIAHVTQTHVLRSVERAQRDSVPILLAMLGAIAIAQSGSSSSGDAAMAAMASAQGIAAQRQINYTRSNESEADRIGIRTMARKIGRAHV